MWEAILSLISGAGSAVGSAASGIGSLVQGVGGGVGSALQGVGSVIGKMGGGQPQPAPKQPALDWSPLFQQNPIGPMQLQSTQLPPPPQDDEIMNHIRQQRLMRQPQTPPSEDPWSLMVG